MIAELMRSMPSIASADHCPTLGASHGAIHGPVSPSMDDARHDASRDGPTQPEAEGVSNEFTAALRRSLQGKSDAQTPTDVSDESDFVDVEPEAVTSPTEAVQATDTAVIDAPGFEPPSVAPGSLTDGGSPTSSDDEATPPSELATLIRDAGDAGDAVTAPHVPISPMGDVLNDALPLPDGAALSTSIETFLAAHHHRMRGALGTPVSVFMGHVRSDGDTAPRVHFVQTTEFAALPTLAAEKTATETAMPFRLSGVNHHGASLAALPAMTEGVAGVPPIADGALIPALRATHAEVAAARDGVSAATPGEKTGAHTLAADSAALARTLSERVTSMAHNGVHEARLRLTPAELGDIGIVVRKSAMLLSVTLQVARPEVLGLVQGTAALLRDMLSQRHTGEVQVSTGAMTAFDGDGASGDTSKRRSRDAPENDAMPGLALGASERGRHDAREVFRL